MAQEVSRRLLNLESRVWSQASTCYVCGEQSGTGTVISPSTSVIPCQYHAISAPYSASSTCYPH